MPPLEASPPTPESQPAGDVIARLEYGQKLPLHKQHRVRRWIVPASLLLLIYVVLQQVPPIWHRIQLYRSQSECLKHPVSPGVLVYSSGPPVVAVAQTQFAQFFNLYKATQFSPPLSMISTWHNQNLADLMLERWPVVPFSATVYIGRRQGIGISSTRSIQERLGLIAIELQIGMGWYRTNGRHWRRHDDLLHV